LGKGMGIKPLEGLTTEVRTSLDSEHKPQKEQRMLLKKGDRVEELTKKTGQRPRVGVVIDLRTDSVSVRWDDGHVSSLTGALLRPAAEPKKSSSR